MSKRTLGAAVVAMTILAGAPAVGQETDQHPTPSARGSDVGGLSYSECEDLLGRYGAEESVTSATPPEQVLYCLGVAQVPQTPEEEANARCDDLRSSGRLQACETPGTLRVIDALDRAVVGPLPEGFLGATGPASPAPEATPPATAPASAPASASGSGASASPVASSAGAGGGLSLAAVAGVLLVGGGLLASRVWR